MTPKQIEQLERRNQDRCYVVAVNSFIPKASAIATRTATGSRKETGVDGKEFEWCTWTEIFHREMGRLCREAGIR
jgi:hypothetical protein